MKKIGIGIMLAALLVFMLTVRERPWAAETERETARLEERRTGEVREQERIVAMLNDSYDLTVSMAIEQAKPLENLLAAENELEELRKRISSLGSVNMESIEEYRTVAERDGVSRSVTDYLSSMSDRYAEYVFTGLFIPKSWSFS